MKTLHSLGFDFYCLYCIVYYVTVICMHMYRCVTAASITVCMRVSLTGLFIGTLTPLLFCSIQTLSSGTAVSLSLTSLLHSLLYYPPLLHLPFFHICPLTLFSWTVMINQIVNTLRLP